MPVDGGNDERHSGRAVAVLRRPKVLAAFPIEVVRILFEACRQVLALALRRTYFRVVADARVESEQVSLQARLGRRVQIGSGVRVSAGVVIGDYSYVNHDTEIRSGIIGKFCSIAPSVTIGPPEHPKGFFSTHPATYLEPGYGIVDVGLPYEMRPPPEIGNDVWIGTGAIILRGVRIGDGSIVAANAVVTRDVEPYGIVGGVPARRIGCRFDESTVNRMLEAKWWEDEERVRRYVAEYGSRVVGGVSQFPGAPPEGGHGGE